MTQIQADRIEQLRAERRPSWVRLHHLPGWMRQRCLKAFGSPWDGGISPYAAMQSMTRAVAVHFPGAIWLDNWGSTVLPSGDCVWVTEPFAGAEQLEPVIEWLATQLGCGWFISDNAWHSPGQTTRGVLHRKGGRSADDA